MKFTKLLKVFAKSAIALTFAAFAFSCANTVSDASVSSSDDATRTLNIKVSNYDDLVETSKNIVANRAATSSSARTIIADSFDLDGITLYLYGTSNAGTTYGPTKVTATSDTTNKKVGTVAIPAESQNWSFTLYALDSSDTTDYSSKTTTDLLSVAVLIGYSAMDMTNGDTANFTLSPDGLTKTSDVKLSLTLDSWDLPADYSSTVGIYLLTTGADATTAGDGKGTTKTENTTLTLSSTTATTYEVSSMTPGTYLFKVTFKKTGENKTFTWSDVIIVLPGKKLSASIAIPNVIGTKPAGVTNFYAGYEKEDAYNGLYIVDFNWTRPTTKNENYYEIDILELSSTEESVTKPTNDDWTTKGTSTTYAGISTSTSTVTAFASSDVHEDGSLLGGTNSAQFRLELGKRYYARIRARNDAGSSENYTLVKLTESPTSGTEFTSDTINRYRITYHVNGGAYYTDSSSIDPTAAGFKLTSNSSDVVAYFCQNTSGNPIIQADGTIVYTVDSTDSYYYFYYDTYTWSYWNYYNSGAATKYADTDDKSYTNLDLYAIYTTDASVEIDDKSAYDILNSWITLTVADTTGTATGPTAVTGGTGAKASITFADNYSTQSATWKFLPVTDSNKITSDFKFDEVYFTVTNGSQYYAAQSKTDVDTTTGWEITQNLTGLSGTYHVLFTARTGTTSVSYPITLTITR